MADYWSELYFLPMIFDYFFNTSEDIVFDAISIISESFYSKLN